MATSRQGEPLVTIDLDALTLRSGEAARLDVKIRPEPPVSGGVQLAIAEDPVAARVDISRTTSGFALRLRAEATIAGTCARCLDPAEQPITVDAREVDHLTAEDLELRSPYVSEGVLAVDAWLHDVITLEAPDQLHCRPDCQGLCEECGANLNRFAPGEHDHGPKLDPRFAKLRELSE